MKIQSKFLVLLISIIILASLAGCSTYTKDVQSANVNLNVKVTAHAGCMGTPEDSLESVIAGVGIKADICEVDVNMLGDGTPVLKHNAVQKSDTNLVRLSQVFEYIKDKKIKLNLDIKNFNASSQVEIEASKYGVSDKVFYTGIDEGAAEKLQSSKSKISYYLNYNLENSLVTFNYNKHIDELIDKMKKLGAIGINTDYHYCTAEAVDKIHKAGLLVSVWTVDDSGSMKKCLDMGVDNITTRHPDVLMEILKKLRNGSAS